MGTTHSPNQPVLVIVPGSFSPPDFYESIVEALSKHDLKAQIVDMPSVGRRDPEPPATMTDDAVQIRSVTEKLADEGRNIILMPHSYGGIPGTESIKGVSMEHRASNGNQGGISKVVYLTSLVPEIGQSCIDFMGQLPPFLTLEDDGYMSHDPVPNSQATFSDLPEEEALGWAKRMPQHSTASFQEGLGYAGYKDVEIGYIVCEDDMIIPVAYQEAMIESMEKSAEKKVDVYRLKSGHCPAASKPQELAKILKEIMVKGR